MIQNNWVNTDIYLSLQKPLTKMCKNNHSTVYWESVISVSNRPEKKEISGSCKFNRISLTVTPKRAEKWRKSYPFTIQAKARTFQRDFFPAKAQHCNVIEAERRWQWAFSKARWVAEDWVNYPLCDMLSSLVHAGSCSCCILLIDSFSPVPHSHLHALSVFPHSALCF